MLMNAIKNLIQNYNLSRDHERQIKYLSQSIKLEEAVSPYIVRITMTFLSMTFFMFILWAALANVSESANTKGEIVPYGFVQLVQHMGGGIVTDILAKEGDIVEKGQIIIKIDDGSANQDLAEYGIKDANLQIKAERLQAFIQEREPDFSKLEKKMTQKEIEHQHDLVDNMIKSREQERNVTKEQINQKQKELDTLNTREGTLTKNLKLAEEILSMQKSLSSKGYTSRLSYINAEKEKNTILGDLEETKNKRDQAKNTLSEFENRLLSLDSKHKDTAYLELEQVQNTLQENREVISKLQNRVDRLNIKSPVHGLIKGLKINTVGGVVEPGKTLMEIVPIDETLVAEVVISPKDIGHINIGQKARIKVSSFDFSRYGVIDGSLDFVSAATFVDDKGSPYYKGRIKLSKNYVGNNSKKNILLPGMTIDADILTGKKSVLSYLLKPIHLSLQSAMNER